MQDRHEDERALVGEGDVAGGENAGDIEVTGSERPGEFVAPPAVGQALQADDAAQSGDLEGWRAGNRQASLQTCVG
jgi:hypothetical protein